MTSKVIYELSLSSYERLNFFRNLRTKLEVLTIKNLNFVAFAYSNVLIFLAKRLASNSENYPPEIENLSLVTTPKFSI